MKYKSWHTILEKKAIKDRGGKPLEKYGYDGLDRNGRPVEVRACRKDDRFRIQKNVHENLVRQKGSYIFCSGGRTKKVCASKVSDMIGRGKWFNDRDYPHKFLRKGQVF